MPPVDPRELIDALRDYYAEHEVLPSYATLSTLAGIRAQTRQYFTRLFGV